jgi:polyhydroxyalkanoate synthesis regulator phasin
MNDDMQEGLLAAIDEGIEAASPPSEPEQEEDLPEEQDDSLESDDDDGEGLEDQDDQGDAEPVEEDDDEDHITDPIPDDVKDRTRTRMEKLLESTKAAKSEARVAQGELNQLVGAIQQTGATPEQFGTMLEMLAGLNSGHEEGQRAALQVIEQTRLELRQALGLEDDQPATQAGLPDDLQDLVDIGHLTEQEAKTLANLRNPQPAQPAQPAQPIRSDLQQAIEQANLVVNAKQTAMKSADPQYAEKIAKLKEDGFTQRLQKMHPSRWADAFQKEYDALTKRMKAEAARNAAPDPLRGGNRNAAGTVAEPQSMEEAVDLGIMQASR